MKKAKSLFTLLLMLAASLILLLNINSKVNAATATSVVTLNHNSYIYNKNGKRANSKKLLKNQKVTVKGSVVRLYTTKKYYLITKWGRINNDGSVAIPNEYSWLPYTIIKGWGYYQLADGGYIKTINISEVNGNEVIASWGSVIVKKNTVFYNINGDETKTKVKKGKKFTVDQYINLKPNWGMRESFYRVSGTNKYLYTTDVKHPRIPLMYDSLEMYEN